MFCFAVASLIPSHAGELIWHPLIGNGVDEFAPIGSIGQVGSEVYLSVGLVFDGSSCDMHSNRIPVEFPTLFVVSCGYEFPRSPDIVILSSTASGSYDYEIGDGWIFHRKGFDGCKPVTDSLGLIYIKHYPWVFFPDVGWRYVVEAGIFEYSNAWWFYEPDFGWFWTTRDLYPWIYHYDADWWIQYGVIHTTE